MQDIRLLFIGIDANPLGSLRQMLLNMRPSWDFQFATTGAGALKLLKESSFNVVVTDLRVPDMDGIELLEKVKRRYPATIRFMLGGYSEQPLRGPASRCVNHFIPKPLNVEVLESLIYRNFRLNGRLRSKQVTDIIGNVNSLPVMSDAYKRVIDVLSLPGCSPREVGMMIARDIGMASRMLKLVNSAFYGSGGKIADTVHAVVYLGLRTVEALVLTSGIFSTLPAQRIKEFGVDEVQEHCVRVGSLTRAICKAWRMSPNEVDAASMAGILHDAGKIILISKLPREWRTTVELSRERQVPQHAAERQILKMTHAELGGALFDLWGLPSAIIEAATYHHDYLQNVDIEASISLAVHIANMVDHVLSDRQDDACVPPLDEVLLETLGVTDELPQLKDLLFNCWPNVQAILADSTCKAWA